MWDGEAEAWVAQAGEGLSGQEGLETLLVGTCQALVTCPGEAQAAGRVGGSVRWPWRRVGEQAPARVTCRHSESTGVGSTWCFSRAF